MGDSVIINGKVFTDKIGEKALCSITDRTVIVPEGITEIGNSAFIDGKMERIKLPSTLKSIGEMAFANCQYLIEIEIPDSVTNIGESAFSGCKRLKSVKLPSSLKKIEDYTFWNCRGLESIEIPDSVTEIGSMAFFFCLSLERVKLSNSLQELKSETFFRSPFKEIIFPDSLKRIECEAFRFCYNIESIHIPKSVECIEGIVAYDTPNLKTITVAEENKFYDSRDNCNAIIETATNTLMQGISSTFPASVRVIGNLAFTVINDIETIDIPSTIEKIGFFAYGTCESAKKITIPASVKEIGISPFSQTPNVDIIEVDKDNKFYDSRDNCNAIIETATNTLLKGCNTTVIPNGVEKIAHNAFSNCKNLTTLTIPKTVKSFDSFFINGCDNLKTIKVPKGKGEYYRELINQHSRDLALLVKEED